MDKPLHARVAEALGWEWRVSYSGGCRWLCPPGSDPASDDLPDSPRATGQERLSADAYGYVPRYDTDWSATGPLIEKYGLEIQPCEACEWVASRHETKWQYDSRRAPTPLLAVCNLILALSEAGKLTESASPSTVESAR